MNPILSTFVRRRRHRVVAAYLTGDVLDLGCGTAHLTQLILPGHNYVGVDRRADLISSRRKLFPHFTFHVRDLEIDELNLARRFDTVALIATVEHLKNPEHIFSQIPMHLKPDGIVVITTPAPFGGLIHAIGTRFGLFSREASDDHQTMFNLNTLRPRLNDSGLKVIEYHRFLLGMNQLFVCQAKEAS